MELTMNSYATAPAKLEEYRIFAAAGPNQDERNNHYYNLHVDKKAVELAHAMKTAELLKEWMEGIEKCLNAELDTLRLALIPLAMEREGLESPLNVSGVGRVSLTGDVYATITDKENFYEWLHDNKSGDLITESVNASTLKAWVKDKIKQGLPYPTEFLNVTPYTRASITKAK